MGRSPWALVWVILEKNFLQTDFEGKKSYKEIPCSNGFLCQGKNSITKGLVKKILVQTKSSISPVKSQNCRPPNRIRPGSDAELFMSRT